MSLDNRLIALAQAMGSDVKALTLAQGQLSALNTTTKTSLVAAINEVDSHADANAAAIAAETSRATAAEAQIASDLSDEVARATAAEQANAAAIVAAHFFLKRLEVA